MRVRTAVKRRTNENPRNSSFSKREIKKLLLLRKKLFTSKKTDRYSLNERIKELSVLYYLSQILVDEKTPLNKILQRIVNILPGGWQYPEITAARITVGDDEFITKNFIETKNKLSSKFTILNTLKCSIEIVYLKNKPQEYYGQFLIEERKLLDMIARMVKVYIERRKVEDERIKITHNLIQRNKSLEEFAFIISHKIRLPVANIIGICAALNTDDLEEEERKEFIQNLHVSVNVFDETIKYLNSLLEESKF